MFSFTKHNNNKIVWFLIVILLSENKNLSKAQCLWNLNTDLPVQNPLYVTADNQSGLILPTARGLYLPKDDEMTLVCPGSSNTIMGTGLQEVDVKCDDDNMLIYNNHKYHLKNLYCTYPLSSNVTQTNLACGPGKIQKLGYFTSRGLSPLMTVCYDKIKETVLFSEHIIYGKVFAASQKDNKRPGFRTNGLKHGIKAANCYKQKGQIKRFSLLLGSNVTKQYITTTSYLARGHLSPDGDFLFTTWAWASYFYVNVAPQWQQINAGNWLRIENLARDIAKKYQENITSMSGIFDVLQLPNEDGKLTDIYLMDNQLLRVPKWFWKVLYLPEKNKGIAFVTSNNPFLTSITKNDLLCPDICEDVSFNQCEFTDFSKGYTYCCDVSTLFSRLGMNLPYSIQSNVTGKQ